MVMSSACSSARIVFSPPDLKTSERSNSLYRRDSFAASSLIRSHACSGLHFFPASSAMPKRYILSISLADWSMISCTALMGVSPVLILRARNSRSVSRPPMRSMQVSSSSRSVRVCDGICFSDPSWGSGSSATSASRWRRTYFLATCGEQSESGIWWKTRSGRALERDLE